MLEVYQWLAGHVTTNTVCDNIVINVCDLWIPSTLPWWFNGPFIPKREPYYRAAEYTNY